MDLDEQELYVGACAFGIGFLAGLLIMRCCCCC